MPDEPTTLSDDEIRTAVVGDVHSKAGTPGPAAADDSDTGDDTGDPTDATDTGDDSGDDSDDSGDDS